MTEINFGFPSLYNEKANFQKIKFGEEAPLLEVELNELQEILIGQQKKLVDELLGKNGFTDFSSKYIGNILTIQGIAVLDGTFNIITPLTLEIIEGESAYIAFKDVEVTSKSIVKSYGNLQSLTDEVNHLVDARIGFETSRRVQRVYNLVKDTSDTSFEYLLLGKIELVTRRDEETGIETSEITFNPSRDIQVNLSLEGGSKIITADLEPEHMKLGDMWIQTGMEKPTIPGERPPIGSFPERLYKHENDQLVKKHIEIIDSLEIPDDSNSVIYYAESMGGEAPEGTFSQQVSERLKKIEDEISTPLVETSAIGKVTEIEVPSVTNAELVSINGRTVANLLPLFGKGQWTTPFTDTLTVVNERTVSIFTTNNTIGKGYTLYYIKLTPGETYTFSAKHNGHLAVKSAYGLLDGEIENLQPDTKAQSVTFTVPSNSIQIQLYLSNHTTAGTCLYENVSLAKGTEIPPFVVGVQGITNPTISVITSKNLLPPLRHWESSSGVFEDVSDNEITCTRKTFTETNEFSTRVISLDVKPNTTYTFTVEGETSNFVTDDVIGFYFNLSEFLTDGNKLIHHKPPYYTNNGKHKFTVTITTSPLVKNLYFVVGGKRFTGTLSIRNAMLYEGSLPVPFESYTEKSFTAIGTFHEGDKVFSGDDGLTYVRRGRREFKLMGNHLNVKPWENRGSYKVIVINVANDAKPNAGILVKPSTKTIITTTMEEAINGHDQIRLGDSSTAFIGKELVLTIHNADSGWGENYLPTQEEVKAYLFGWRMNIRDQWTTPYNGTGVKEWHKIYSGYGENATNSSGQTTGVIAQTGTTILPTVKNDMGYVPHKLVYDLEIPVTEVIKSVGSLTLTKGKNIVKVSSGKIVRDKIVSFWRYDTPEGIRYHANLNPNHGELVKKNTSFENKVKVILALYENGKPFTKYTSDSSGHSHGLVNPYIKEWDYDPTALYEVDYLALEPHRVTVPIDSANISFAVSLNETIKNLVESNSGLEGQLATIGGILPGLMSGVVVEDGSNANGRYIKFASGIVLMFGSAPIELGADKTEIPIPLRVVNGVPFFNNPYHNSVALTFSGAIKLGGTIVTVYTRNINGDIPVTKESVQYFIIGHWK